jgi:hypothetical protein
LTLSYGSLRRSYLFVNRHGFKHLGISSVRL